jgi:DNA-directed RNA polymerase sigma subunit (sigma70/sigma32)|tara:strand:- start:453 stop:659 length:207 start_codon:yes stop_codon:yes gene_type:complete
MPRQNKLADAILAKMVKGAKEEETFTLQQIAAKTGLSAERIRQIERTALRKMRSELEAFCKHEDIHVV